MVENAIDGLIEGIVEATIKSLITTEIVLLSLMAIRSILKKV